MPKVLLVEDDQELREQLVRSLSAEGYTVEGQASGTDALQLLQHFPFDLIVLDWRLPDLEGLEVCRRFRAAGGKTPILLLTAFSDIDRKELGLDAGADDFLAKPFQMRELLARLRSLLRRPGHLTDTDLTVAGVTLTVSTRTASAGGKSVRLTGREVALFEYLLRHTDKLYTAKDLLQAVWTSEEEASEDAVRTCIKTLRFKLDKLRHGDLLKTVLKSGYIIETK